MNNFFYSASQKKADYYRFAGKRNVAFAPMPPLTKKDLLLKEKISFGISFCKCKGIF
jgi:hypothetical protein